MRKFDANILANSKEWLYREYITNKRSIRQIAKECKVSDDTIKTRLNRFGLKIRDRGQANTLGYTKCPHKVTQKVLDARKIRCIGKNIICKNCGELVHTNKKSKKVFCSKSCFITYKKEHLNRNQDWRDWPEYDGWRNLVYIRDHWKCKICSSKRKINAHHIKSGIDFPMFRFDVSNGITLCEKHHILLHKYPSSFIQECIKQTSNIGGTPEVDNPEASIKEYLFSLIRSNDYQEESRTDYGIVWTANITEGNCRD